MKISQAVVVFYESNGAGVVVKTSLKLNDPGVVLCIVPKPKKKSNDPGVIWLWFLFLVQAYMY